MSPALKDAQDWDWQGKGKGKRLLGNNSSREAEGRLGGDEGASKSLGLTEGLVPGAELWKMW